ncbi:polysaccharide deacetylase family protein [Hamadaea sp. NPDC050747]|uniref:polysaccharide deacetylase family protein n=1 Tax=Hamadaea sp. NPDC050747 TaxID=3155789 RepID=UPI0033E89554
MSARGKLGGIKWVGLAGVVVALLGSGHILGRMTAAEPRTAPHAAPTSSAAPAEELAKEGTQAGVAQGPALAAVPAPRRVPITGPNRPPLPREARGPFGSRVTTGYPDIALTFDDGPDPQWTPQVLDLLRAYHIKATFCVIGVMAAEFPQLVRQIVAEGHTLCNHSWQHDVGLGLRGEAAITADLRRTNDAIHRAVPGARVSYFRQPGGAWTPAVVAAATSLGMSPLHWQVDPRDWAKPPSRSIAMTVISHTMPGSIVLMHDGGGNRQNTVTALRSVLPNLVTRFHLEALPPGVDPPKLYGVSRPLHAGQV